MKLIIAIVGFCCVALLPLCIHCDETDETRFQTFLDTSNQNAALGNRGYHNDEKNEIRAFLYMLELNAELGDSGYLINDIFRLSKNGSLGKGGFGVTYKAKFEGTMAYNGKEVALKFTPLKKRVEAEREYEIYTYLGAIDNPVIESFGIPTVYYFGKHDNYTLLAMTLLEPSFNRLSENLRLTLPDILITFRQFVKITKYMHFCGIRHDDIKPENLMFRKNQLFIIDFNLAHKIYKPSTAGTLPYMPRSAHSGGLRFPKHDWESFLYSMCRVVGHDLEWFNLTDQTAIYQLKNDTSNTLRRIEQMPNESMRDFFLLFAKYVFDDYNLMDISGFPAYDLFYNYFDNQIKKFNITEPALVSWLTPDEHSKAVNEFNNVRVMHITEMNEPTPMDKNSYPVVNFDHFLRKYGV